MHETFKAIGCSIKTAPVAVREMLALQENGIRNLLANLKNTPDITEALVVSTCNRTEIYYSSATDCTEQIIKLLATEKNLEVATISPYLVAELNHEEASRQLFRMAIGLESSVVGDLQIINQVKQAYQLSADANMAGPFIHRLLHTIFFANKKVVQETGFRDGAASVSYAAQELVEELTQLKPDPKILVLGLGEIGADLLRHLVDHNYKNISVCNRTEEKAAALVVSLPDAHIEQIAFAAVWQAIADADVVISSIATDKPFISKNAVEGLMGLHYKYFIDLSVPRSIEAAVESLPGALVYNIDQINVRVNQAVEARLASIPQVEAIIEAALLDFADWTKEMVVSPTIQKLKSALEQIRQEEVTRHLRQMTDEETRLVDKITRNMMQKILKLPVLQLKAACRRGEADTLIDVLNDLFNLEAQNENISH